ncbi:trehalose-phosphatase [Bradyrhizobium sp.]|uniref:trehalose-phosphatase n=1 Tax=Bradyrhizobium sp. TaxID=376 RepID=UPI0025B8B447|nr:trehalose-phosphatase [Bradyrhizobium sp.]MBV8921674.1 trehalose-phosphatase [Bradyrhizobium sp.]
MKDKTAEAALRDATSIAKETETDCEPVTPPALPGLRELAILLDIDGTLIELAPTPRAIVVPDGLVATLHGLLENTAGALALVSGRSLADIDWIFAPDKFPAVGGHGAEMRLSADMEAVDVHAPAMEKELKRRLAAVAEIDSKILVEDKGYSLALHYRLAPHAEKTIYAEVARIRAELSSAPLQLLPGKSVLEIKHAGFTKATGVRELMSRVPFKGRRPLFIGDDVTDESVFDIMPDFAGFSFSVGRRARAVSGHFHAPADVRAFLAQLLRGNQPPAPA